MDSLISYRGKGNILITGDLNARVGLGSNDQDFSIPVIDHLGPFGTQGTTRERSSCDVTQNRYGKKLTQICKGFNLKIANGRVPGDRLGNFTCFANRGASVVDLVISDQSFLGHINRLTILPPDLGSVHSPLSLELYCSFADKNNIANKVTIPPHLN